ncbi:MAG: hypothetical protein R6V84_07525 [Desulfobacterales bacterium]
MDKPSIEITDSARKFMDAGGIDTVTFRLFEDRVGCCVGVVKEIEAVHEAPQDAADYLCHCAEDRQIFISRRIRIIGPLKLATEGLWRKRLSLSGASVPLIKDW